MSLLSCSIYKISLDSRFYGLLSQTPSKIVRPPCRSLAKGLIYCSFLLQEIARNHRATDGEYSLSSMQVQSTVNGHQLLLVVVVLHRAPVNSIINRLSSSSACFITLRLSDICSIYGLHVVFTSAKEFMLYRVFLYFFSF